jgi:hypothetical protein
LPNQIFKRLEIEHGWCWLFIFKRNNSGNAAKKGGLSAGEKHDGSIRDPVDKFSEIHIGRKKSAETFDLLVNKSL